MRILFLSLIILVCTPSLLSQNNIAIENSYDDLIKKISSLQSSYPDSILIIANKLHLEKEIYPKLLSKTIKGKYHASKQQTDSALFQLEQVEKSISLRDFPKLYLKNKIALGIALRQSDNDWKKLIPFFQDIIHQADSLSDYPNKMDAKLELAKITRKYNLEESLKMYHEIISDLENRTEKEHKSRLAAVYFQLGSFYERSTNDDPQEKYTNAITYYKKSVALSKEVGSDRIYYEALIKYASKNRDFTLEKSQEAYQEAYTYFKKIKNTIGQMRTLNFLAFNEFKSGRTKEAIKLWETGYQLSYEENYSPGMMSMASNIIPFAMRINDNDKAEKYGLALEKLLETSDDFGERSTAARSLSGIYVRKKDYKKAYEYNKAYWVLRDSNQNRIEKRNLAELETKYQTEKKEQEIALLQAQNETVEAQKKNQRNLLLGGLGLTSIAGIFLFLGFRNRKKTNDKLRELDTMKSSFFENISHEFRTPLSLISGPIEEQLQKPDIDTSEKKNLSIAKRNTKRLLTLVDQLLDLSKVEAGHFKLNVQQGDLPLFLKSLTSSFSYLAQENNQEYTATIDIPENTYYFDADALEKIITNLISNALKYSPDGESIAITGAIENQKLHFTIQNSGTTLSDEALQTIFNRFARADEQTAGTGIGLALSKELVSLHKGTIHAQSEHNTTAFTITIPVTESAFLDSEKTSGVMEMSAFTNLPASRTEAEATTSNEEIIQEEVDIFSKDTNPILLIVDDNADLRTYVSSLFEDQYTIHTAQDGQEGFEMASSIVPDLIITDLMMPKDDGITLTRNCKASETTSHIPIVMLTAKAGDENQLIGLETGANAYITKPFNTEILKTTTHNLLETRKRLQERFSQEVVLIPKDIAVNSADERFLDNLKEIVDTQIIESDFTTESFAKALGMSRMQLHRKLKALTGLSATEFIRSQRLKLAAQLLKKSDINVSQVGYAVGFNNHSYFTKCFKEHYGVSPSDYAKKA